MIRYLIAAAVLAVCIAGPRVASAQGVEVTPFGGSALGIALDIPLPDGFQIDGFFSRDRQFPTTIDQWHVGGLQEWGGRYARPFLTGTVGLTRYAVETGSETRFALGAGGGVKLFAGRHAALRLEARVFATFIDGEGTAFACSPGWCFVALHADVDWRAALTAGLTVKLP